MTPRAEEAPAPVIRRPRLVDRLVWLFPLAAAAAAGYFARSLWAERGPLVTLAFAEAEGLRDDTPVEHRGIRIGRVDELGLSDDDRRALVRVRLRRGEDAFARKGAAYWLVRPTISGTGVAGLTALASGPYIEARPGDGDEEVLAFPGGVQPPPDEDGLLLTLRAPARGGVSVQAPLTYRGLRVGEVRDARLSPEADGVELRVFVERRYAPLVRERSRFWTVPGLDVKGGLVGGVELKLDSISRLVTGEIAFATPDKDPGAPARDGARFELAAKPEKDWTRWSPRIPIKPARESGPDRALPTGRDLMGRKGG